MRPTLTIAREILDIFASRCVVCAAVTAGAVEEDE